MINWLKGIDNNKIYLSVITMGEIRKGIEKLDQENKKQKLIQWLEVDLIRKFTGKIISTDHIISDKWGYVCSKENIPAIDALIAASALVNNFKLVTRNTKDFERISGLEIINPWLLYYSRQRYSFTFVLLLPLSSKLLTAPAVPLIVIAVSP